MLFSTLIWATLKGKNMLPMIGSTFLPLIVELLKMRFPLRCKKLLYKIVFDDTDANILRMCVHLLLMV